MLNKNSPEFYFSVSHKKLFSDKFFFLLIKILLNEFFYSTLVFPLGNFFHEFHTIFFLLNLFLSARFHYFSPEFFLLLSLTSADYPLCSTCRCISYLLATSAFNIRKHFFKFRPEVVFYAFYIVTQNMKISDDEGTGGQVLRLIPAALCSSTSNCCKSVASSS